MISPQASLLRLVVDASDRWRGKPLYRAIVETARAMHMAGASVFLVDRSYGTHRHLRDLKSEYLSVHIPVTIEVVDAPDRVAALLDELGPMLADGLTTIEPVQVLRYTGHSEETESDAKRTNP